ncbi:MAG: Rrf2 family transcriptional regulator [Pirellulaceae bacterium]|nr:Rrf2 family transcriptional regulator [Pirellulaceae bacterium]
MFSQTVEYALRAMVQLAHTGQEGCSTNTLAERTLVPRAYLSKVLQSLRASGLLNSQRGIGGGVYLARPAEAISILEVVNAIEPIRRIHSCPMGALSHADHLCALHTKVDSALAKMEEMFGGTTLADMISGKHCGAIPLCEVAQCRKN